MSDKDGGPAFPATESIDTPYDTQVEVLHPGMTLRDYFAAAAMTGLISSKLHSMSWHPEDDAKYCYTLADTMLEARNR